MVDYCGFPILRILGIPLPIVILLLLFGII